ncbi:site-specific integrase [Nonlabens xiamenensis]|uniref:site-specific integrase n=1 Tax=Nonlabens xiamenensis TaxID=2341043 RepID=UPI000F60F7DB|nr:site-specific integrase [Nonlabens xiamenensis]
MYQDKLSVLFVLQKAKLNKKGLCPIKCRLTYMKKRRAFSTGLFINPDFWNSKKQKAFPPTEQNELLNSQLSLISQKINKAFFMLQVQDEEFDVADILYAYQGKNVKKNKTFLETMALHNSRMKKLVGKSYAPRYFEKWLGTETLLKDFISFTYKKSDVLLSSLTMKFLEDLDYFLKSEKGHKQITVNKCIQRVRKVISLAISEGYLQRDPFISYKPKRYKKEVLFLTQQELKLLEEKVFVQERLQQVRDMFVFCCYTGLAYAEMSSLTRKNVEIGFDCVEWIKMKRKKTSSQLAIPLLPKAKSILELYSDLPSGKLLPVISNQKFNSYLKEIAGVCGIEKRMTHHLARKTFATTVLLYNDVPMEIVSELLGHSNMSITQAHYGKVVQKSISEQMKSLAEKLKVKEG